MSREDYIKGRMSELAMNIDEFSIGQVVVDSDKSICKTTDKTLNTIEVFIEKKISTCKSCNGKGKVKKEIEVKHKRWWKRIFGIKMKIKVNTQCEQCIGMGKTHYGIDCKNWFDMKEFNKRFTINQPPK